MAAVKCQVLQQLNKKFSEKSLFSSVSFKDYRPFILTSEYVVASHDSFCPMISHCSHFLLHRNLVSKTGRSLLFLLDSRLFKFII